MNIEETINTMELKLRQIDALFDASMEAENAGERFKAHWIAKDAEKIANDLEKLVDEMDCSDLDELLQEKEEAEVEDTVVFFKERADTLSVLAKEYEAACQENNELKARSKLKEIQNLGLELAHVKDKL